jgi:magnesium chelatase accessory protein
MFPAGRAEIRVRRTALPNRLTLRVAESGDAGAPPVLLVHGWGASIYMWRDWFTSLAAAGYRPIAVDLPGHGLSDKPTAAGAYSLPRQVAWLRELVTAEGLAGAPMVAQSMGASITLELALAQPSESGPLALINPSLFGRIAGVGLARLVTPTLVDATVAHRVPRWMVSRVHRRVYAEPSRITARDVDEYWAPLQLPGYARALWQMLHEFQWERSPAEQMAERLRTLRQRPLVMLGARDALVRDARPYVAALERAGAPIDVHVLAGLGHAANEEAPAVVIQEVLRFLRSRDRERGEQP